MQELMKVRAAHFPRSPPIARVAHARWCSCVQQMAQEGDKSGQVVSGSQIGRIVGLQSQDISVAAAE
jgi:hypothetical protein